MFIAFVTKPSNDSFGDFISNNAPFGYQTFVKIVTNSNAKITDFGFFKTAKFNDGSTIINGIGIFNNWFVSIQQYRTHHKSEFNNLFLNTQQYKFSNNFFNNL